MQRIITSQTHAKQQDMQRDYYLNQKKAIEINPRHPLVKELLRRVEDNPEDAVAKDMALMMFNTATLRYKKKLWKYNEFLLTLWFHEFFRSGFMLKDTVAFALHIENMMRETLGVSKDETVEEEEDLPEDEEADEDEEGEEEEEDDDEQVAEEETIDDEDSQTKDELWTLF